MALNPEEIADLVVTTQRQLGAMHMTEIATNLQEHIAMSRLLKKEKVSFQSGRAIEFRVLMEPDNNTRNVGLFSVDNVNQQDGAVTGVVPWRQTTSGYTFDRVQVSMNRTPSKIVDFVKEKRTQQLIGQAQLMEANFWGEPVAAADDTTPFGLKYWLVYNATEGFNGGNNANFAAGPAAISRTTYPRWRNYTFNYVNVTKADLIRKWRRAAAMCRFMPPVQPQLIPDYSTGYRYGYYTTYDILSEIEEIVEAQNDRLGNDVASKDGLTLFRRTPITWVPYLQENEATADPIVGLDWGVFKPVFLRGEWLREDPPAVAPLQHTVMQAFTDSTYNFVCRDCRHLFLGAKATWH